MDFPSTKELNKELIQKARSRGKRIKELEQEKKDLIQTLGRQELIKLKHEMALIEIENLVSGYEGDMAEAVIKVVQKSL